MFHVKQSENSFPLPSAKSQKTTNNKFKDSQRVIHTKHPQTILFHVKHPNRCFITKVIASPFVATASGITNRKQTDFNY